MLERAGIIERIKSLPDESLKEIADFIEFLDAWLSHQREDFCTPI
jgi:hypothetical protein